MKIPFRAFVAFLLTAFMSLALTSDPAHADSKKYKRSVEKYNIPDVVLINQDGKKVRLASLLNSDQPVIVDFIYGTCTTICPVLSAGFVNLQRKLAAAKRLPKILATAGLHLARQPCCSKRPCRG